MDFRIQSIAILSKGMTVVVNLMNIMFGLNYLIHYICFDGNVFESQMYLTQYLKVYLSI